MDPIETPTTPAKEERTWGMIAHLSAVLGYMVIPFGNILGPLVVWLLKKDTSEFVSDQGKEALNAQISYTIYLAVSGFLCLVGIGFVLFPIVYVAGLIFLIVATVQSNEGVRYRYPYILRFIK